MEKIKIPDNYPQDKTVYLEQLEVLGPLVKDKPLAKPSTSQATQSECARPGTMLEKLQKAAPYNLFFTTIPKSPDTSKQANSVTFPDLLCPSLGQLKCSLQINFMIDIGWLMEQYKARNLE